MSDKTFNIVLDYDGMHYEGWVNPSDKLADNGLPKSYHVVLNDTMFGNVSLADGKWLVDEQRPAGMVEAVGEYIQAHGK